MAFFVQTPEGILLNVKAQPRSSKAGIGGILGNALKIKICCAPVDGKANKELCETLADFFDISKSRVIFKSGEISKQKSILLTNLSLAQFNEKLANFL